MSSLSGPCRDHLSGLPTHILAPLLEQSGGEPSLRQVSKKFRAAFEMMLKALWETGGVVSTQDAPFFPDLMGRVKKALPPETPYFLLFREVRQEMLRFGTNLQPLPFTRVNVVILRNQIEDKSLYLVWSHIRGLFPLDTPACEAPLAEIRSWLQKTAAVRDFPTLDLSRLSLRALPSEIALFSGLQVLTLTDNHLRFLPPWICSLTALEVLDLQYNDFHSLADALQPLPALRHLILMQNPLCPISREELRALGKAAPELEQLHVDIEQLHLSPLFAEAPILKSVPF